MKRQHICSTIEQNQSRSLMTDSGSTKIGQWTVVSFYYQRKEFSYCLRLFVWHHSVHLLRSMTFIAMRVISSTSHSGCSTCNSPARPSTIPRNSYDGFISNLKSLQPSPRCNCCCEGCMGWLSMRLISLPKALTTIVSTFIFASFTSP